MTERKIKKRTIIGTTQRPRLTVFRSLKYIYVQVVDDSQGKTLAAASSLKSKSGCNIAAAQAVGKKIAQAALEKGIKKVVFDRGAFRYHGKIKALADAAREGGLIF